MALGRIAFGVATLSAARLFQLASSFVAIPFLRACSQPGISDWRRSRPHWCSTFDRDAVPAVAGGRCKRLRSLVERLLGVLMQGRSCAVIFALAWPAAAFFGEPRLAPIVITLAWPRAHGTSGNPGRRCCRRKVAWRSAAGSPPALAAPRGLAIAFQVAGAWALVWHHLTQLIAKPTFSRHRLQVRHHSTAARLSEHWRFMRDTAAWSMTSSEPAGGTADLRNFLAWRRLALHFGVRVIASG